MQWPFGKTRKVKCFDGSERIIFKNPDDAFPLVAKDWSVGWEATVEALKGLQGRLGGGIEKYIGGFFAELDEANRSMQIAFRAIYVAYLTDPCNSDDWLRQETRKVIERENENRLKRIEREISGIESLRRRGLDEQALEKALAKSLGRLLKSDTEEKISKEFQKVKKNTSAWRK